MPTLNELFDSPEGNFSDNNKNMPRKREFPYNKSSLYAVNTDPYGFWHVETKAGPLPKALEGSFTSFDLIKSAIEGYIRMNTKP